MSTEELKRDETFIHACKIKNLNSDRVGIARNVIWVPTNKRGRVAYMTNNYQIKDIDVDIATHPTFVEKTRALGLDPQNFYLFENVIAVATPRKDFYCLMDRNFNIFWMSKYSEENLERMSEYLYSASTSSVAFEDNRWTLPRPLSNLSINTLLNLASRIDGINRKDFHFRDKRQLFISVNRELYMAPKDDTYGLLLCLIKYLGESSEFYFEKLLPLMLGEVVSEPTIASNGKYLITLIDRLFSMTKEAVETDRELDYREVLASLGQFELTSRVETYMPSVLELLKKYHKGSISMEILEQMVDQLTIILALDDKTWREKDTILHLCQKSLEDLFKPKEIEKQQQFLPKE